MAPSAVPFRDGDPAPHALSKSAIHALIDHFRDAAERALRAGFDVVEIHGAHGYLIHEFLSPLSNRRTDEYGGTLDNRLRFALEVTEAVRGAWPAHLPLFFRISATDWVPGGWTADDSVELVRRLQSLGVDLVDCSSGGNAADAKIPLGPGYQVPFASAYPSGDGDAYRRRRYDHDAAAGGRNHTQRTGRRGPDGARISARPLLRAARGKRLGRKAGAAGAIRPRFFMMA